MIKLGITGGIGSGKSVVCNVFKCLGVPVFNADDCAKQLMDNNADLINKIKVKFGDAIYNNGKLVRSKLAEIVFKNKAALSDLNAMVHPLVALEFSNWLSVNKGANYVIKEAAILFESNAYLEMDKIATVTAPELLRIERVVRRDNTSKELVTRRILNQLSDSEKIKRSDFVIINDDVKAILPQVLAIHELLSNRS